MRRRILKNPQIIIFVWNMTFSSPVYVSFFSRGCCPLFFLPVSRFFMWLFFSSFSHYGRSVGLFVWFFHYARSHLFNCILNYVSPPYCLQGAVITKNERLIQFFVFITMLPTNMALLQNIAVFLLAKVVAIIFLHLSLPAMTFVSESARLADYC